MFYAHFMYTATELRDMEDDFGILPFPKKDEKQEKYITGLRDTFVGFCVPTGNKDPEFVGTIMEALCVSGSKNVIPAYYDVVLKVKTARDEDSADMLDIIKESVTVDFAYAYGIELDNMANIFYMAYNAENGFASLWESQKESAEAKLEALLENFE